MKIFSISFRNFKVSGKYFVVFINPIQDEIFFGPPLPKIRHTYHAMMKLGKIIPYLRRSKKCINHVTHLLSHADISLFSPEISKFCYIKKYTYRLDFDTYVIILLAFLESLVIVLINMVTTLMMSAKITTPGLLEIRVF